MRYHGGTRFQKEPTHAMDEAREPTPHALTRFSDEVRGWFLDAFPEPTPLQECAWDVIEGGENALVIAPTGSGKTLAAFLFAIDELMREKAATAGLPKKERPGKGVRVLYISPLKALGADVERNLQAPLAGIAARMAAAGGAMPEVRTGMRTGDTTPDQRRSLQRNPPDILITTPESLYLMLTSQARETLRTVETVIVDEVHALAGSKRGAHLALSLERLDDLLEKPAQRIGLSATVRPRDEIARFLGGPHPVRVVASEGRPDMDVRVRVPVRDMTAVPTFGGSDLTGGAAGKRGGGPRRAPAEEAWKSDRALRAAMAKSSLPASTTSPDSRLGSSSIWPYIEASILDEVLAHRTTIVFVNSRGLCEKLTARLNDLYAKRMGIARGVDMDAPAAPIRSDLGSTADMSTGAPAVIAKAHHGSVSKEKRLQVERELKAGELPCVVATSSLELGIDMGSIDLVLQVAAPPSVASALQRIGRANHQVGGRSTGSIFPRTRTEIIDAAVAAEGMYEGRIEQTALVKNALDVLAQQTVAAVAMDELAADDWFDTVRRAAPYSELPRRAFDSVLSMLAGRYATADLAEFSPRIVWDRERGRLLARPGTQRQAVMSAGTIPDRGMFSVVLPEGDGAQGRRRVGELDEEMVYESRVGDIITLGTSSWRISEITRDRVIVEPAPGRSARLPFWHGEGVGRPAETGRMRGAFLRAVAAGIEGDDAEAEEGGFGVSCAVSERLAADGLDDDAQRNLVELIRSQRAATGIIPDDKTLVVERCEDEQGDWRVLLHSPYGRRVHEPWAMAVSDRIMAIYGYDAQAMAADDGIVLRIPMTETRLPGIELFAFDPDELDRIVRDRVGSTSLFSARFRECAARALLMSPIAPGKRAPLWQQRLKAGQLLEAARREREFPILVETARECLQDVYDMRALHELMEQVQAGSVRLVEAQTSVPSPFAAPLLFGYVGERLYAGDLPHAEQRASLLSLDPTLLGELLGSTDLGDVLDADVIAGVEAGLQRLAPDRRMRGVEGAADLLRVLGPLSVEEAALRMRSDAEADDDGAADEGGGEAATEEEAHALLEELQRAHRAFTVVLGGKELWAAVDDAAFLRDALGATIPPWADALNRPASQSGQAQAPLRDPERSAQREIEGSRAASAESDGGEDALHPLDELLARYARTHGPFSAEAAAARFGIGVAVARDGLARLASAGRLMQGRFGEDGDGRARAWVETGVFRRLRSLSLAEARRRAGGEPERVRALPDRPARSRAAGRGAIRGHRRTRPGDRPVRRRVPAGFGLGGARVPQPRARLSSRHARRAAGFRRRGVGGRSPRRRRGRWTWAGAAASQLPRARSRRPRRVLSHRFAVRARTARSGRCAVRRAEAGRLGGAVGRGGRGGSARVRRRLVLPPDRRCGAPTACARVRRRGGRSLHHARAHVGRARDERHVRAGARLARRRGRCCGQAAQRAASTCEQPPVRHAHRRFSDDAGHSVRAGRGGRGSDGAVVAHHAVAGERHGARHRAGGIDPRSLRRAVSRRGAAVGRARWAGRVASRAAADGGRGGCAARRVRAGPRPRAVRRARDHRRAAHLRGGRRRGRSTRARRARCRRSRVPVRCRPALAAGRARRCRGRGGA